VVLNPLILLLQLGLMFGKEVKLALVSLGMAMLRTENVFALARHLNQSYLAITMPTLVQVSLITHIRRVNISSFWLRVTLKTYLNFSLRLFGFL